MVSNLQDSVLKTIHNELSETLRKTETRLSDAFEFEESSVPEEVVADLLSVRDSLMILGESTAAELTDQILTLAKSRLSQRETDDMFNSSDVADAFLVLSEYVDSDDHSVHESVLQATIAKMCDTDTTFDYEESTKKSLKTAASKLSEVKDNPNQTKTWQLAYKVGGAIKKIAQTKEIYDFWWLFQEISRQQVQGASLFKSDEDRLVLNDAASLLNQLATSGETASASASVVKSFALLNKLFESSGQDKADYRPPSVSLMSETGSVLFPVSKKTIEDVAFLVKRELSIVKNLFEQSENEQGFAGREGDIVETITSVSAVFELFSLEDVVEQCQTLIEQLKFVDFSSGKYVKDFAENTVRIEDSLWALSYADNDGIQANNYTQNIALHTTTLSSAEQFNRYFRLRRDDIITGNFEFTADAFMQAAASIHEMYSTEVLLGETELADKLAQTEKTHLYLVNEFDALKDKKALNAYVGLLVTYEIIFEDILNGGDLSQRSSAVLDKTQEHVNAAIRYSDKKCADPQYGNDSAFATNQDDDDLDFSIDDIALEDDSISDSEETIGSMSVSAIEAEDTDFDNYEGLAEGYGLSTTINHDIKTVATEELESDMLEIFLEEVTEIYENMGKYLDVLLKNPHDETHIGNIRRAFHTIKGSGRMVGLQAFGEFGWQHEELLNKVISNEIEPNLTLIKTLSVAKKLIGNILEKEPFVEDTQALLQGAATAQALREYMLDNGEPELQSSNTLSDQLPRDSGFNQNLSDVSESVSENANVKNIKALSEHPALKDAIKDIVKDGDLKQALVSELKQDLEQHEEKPAKSLSSDKVASDSTSAKIKALANIADILSKDPDITQSDLSAAVKSLDTIDEKKVDPSHQALLSEAKALGEAIGDVGEVKSELGEIAAGLSGALSALTNPNLSSSELDAELKRLQDMRQNASEVKENVDVETLAADTASKITQKSASMGLSDTVKQGDVEFATPMTLDFYESTLDDVQKTQENYEAWENTDFKGFDELSDLHKNIETINQEARRTEIAEAEKLTHEVGNVLSQLESDEIVPPKDVMPPIRDAVSEIKKMHDRLPKGEDATVDPDVLSGLHTTRMKLEVIAADVVADETVAMADLGDDINLSAQAAANQLTSNSTMPLVDNDIDAQAMSFNSTHLEGYYNELIEPLQSARQNYSDWASNEFNDNNTLSALSGDFGTISNVSNERQIKDAAKISDTVSDVLSQIAEEDLVVNQKTVEPISYSLEALEKMHRQLPLGGEVAFDRDVEVLRQEVRNVVAHASESSDACMVESEVMSTNTMAAETSVKAADTNISGSTLPLGQQESVQQQVVSTAAFMSSSLKDFYETTSSEIEEVNQNLSEWKASNFTNQEALSSLQGNVGEVNVAGAQADLTDVVELTDALNDTLDSMLAEEIDVDYDTVKPVEDALVDLQAMHATLPSGGDGSMPLVGLQHLPALSQLTVDNISASDVVGSPQVNTTAPTSASQVISSGPVSMDMSEAAMGGGAPLNTTMTFGSEQLRTFFEESRSDILGAKHDFANWEKSSYQDDEALDSLREHVDSVTDAGQQANLTEAAELSGSLSEALSKIAEEDIIVDDDMVQPIKDAVNAVDALHQSLPQGGTGTIPAQFSGSLSGIQQFMSMVSAEQLSQINPAAVAAQEGSITNTIVTEPAKPIAESLTREGYDEILKQLSGQVFSYNTEVKRSGKTHEEIIESIYELESQLDEKSVSDHLWEVLSALENAITAMKKHGRVPTGRTQEIIEEILHKFKTPDVITEAVATRMINDLMAIRADIDEMTVPMPRDRLGDFQNQVSSKLQNLDDTFSALKSAETTEQLKAEAEKLSSSLEDINHAADVAGYKDGKVLTELLRKALSEGMTTESGLDEVVTEAIERGISSLNQAFDDIVDDGQGIIDKDTLEDIEEVVEQKEAENSAVKFNDASELDETILEIFIDEAKNILEQSNDNIETWSRNPHDNDALLDLKRNLHTLKGSARMAELTVFGDLTHEMENLLDYISDDRIEDVRTAGKLLRKGQGIGENMVSLAAQHAIVEENPAYLDELDKFMSEQTGLPRQRGEETTLDKVDEQKSHDEINDELALENQTSVADANDTVLTDPSLNVSPSMSDFTDLFDDESENVVASSRPLQAQPSSTSAMSNDTTELDETILDIFTDEAKEILAISRPMVESWAENPEDTSLVPELRRDMHTLKGGARMAELTVMGDLAQSMEHMLDDVLDNKLSRKSRAASLLLDAQTHYELMIKIAEERGVVVEDESLTKRYENLVALESGHEVKFPDVESASHKNETMTPVTPVVEEPDHLDKQINAEKTSTPTQHGDDGIRLNDTSLLDSDILELFTEEAHSILEKCRQYTNAWSDDPKNYAAVQGLQRSMHTLKGGARMAELTVFGNTAHEVENVLDMIADGQIKQKSRAAKLLQEAQLLFEGMVDTAENRGIVKEDTKFLDKVSQLTREETGDALEDKKLSSAQLFDNEKASDDKIKQVADDAARKAATLAAEKAAKAVTDSTPQTITDTKSSQQATKAQTQSIADKTQTKKPQKDAAKQSKSSDKQAELTKALDKKDNKSDKKKQTKKRAYTVRVGGETLERLNTLVGETVISRSRVERNITDHGFQLTELARTVDRIAEQLRRLDSETEAQILFRRESILDDDEQFDPLELDRFSEIQQLSRSLSESVNDLQNIRQTLSNHVDDTRQLLSQEKYIQQEIQELLLSTSMVRFDSILPRIERIVYQVSEELGKEVELQIFGGQIEIERNMIEDLLPGFEHSIRNSLAHGIEMPEVREKLGKPRAGLLRIGVKRDGAEVIFVITDDGQGANYDKIRTKARQMGILDESKVDDKKYLANLMFGQGFSTADKTTQVAGRGIGMDVLRDVVNARKGSIDIETETGKGLATSIRLPFSMSVTDALLIKTGRFSYAVPSVSIEGSSKMQFDVFEGVLRGDEVYHQYGQYRYRVMSLTKYFDPSAKPEYTLHGVPLLLVRIGTERIALEVEQIISRQEITIKSVNEQMNNIPGIIGASILDTGDPIAVLEAATVARSLWDMQLSGADVSEAITEAAPITEQKVKILHVDDSITMRKITAKMLSKYEVESESAKDGLDAIDIIQDWMPDVILLDIEMPRMDGFEFATHVRNRPEFNHVPIIMITSRTGEKHRERAMKIGANGYMGKPYREDLLVEEIERLLNRKLNTL